jgi:hypothetical protein
VRELVLTRARARVLVRVLVSARMSVSVSVSVQVSMWALALVQALSLASLQASAPAHSFPPACRLLSRRSSDLVLQRVALQGRGARIAAVVPRSRCKT